MDLTPQALRDVEFREKLRGYHPDDVDDFLEEAAVALDSLLARLSAAEAAAGGPVGGPSAPATRPHEDFSEDTLRRTLLLAQRTADLAIAEAHETAEAIVEEARAEAARSLEEARTRSVALVGEAEAKARASTSELEERQEALEREFASLRAWASQHRDRLRDAISDEMRALDIWLATSARPQPGGAGAPAVARAKAPAGPANAPAGPGANASADPGGVGRAGGDKAPAPAADSPLVGGEATAAPARPTPIEPDGTAAPSDSGGIAAGPAGRAGSATVEIFDQERPPAVLDIGDAHMQYAAPRSAGWPFRRR